jgi:cytochrome c oxidase cbb3-type subunit 3
MKKINILLLMLMISGWDVMAQDAAPEVAKVTSQIPVIMTDPMNYLILFVMVILLSTILVMSRVIRILLWNISGKPASKKSTEQSAPEKSSISFWKRLNTKLNDSTPVEKEEDILLDHEYDGIKELDNNLPPWWKYGFYLTIVFSLVYLVHYHVSGSGNGQLEEYQVQLNEAEQLKTERLKEAAGNVDETNVTLLSEASAIAEGKKVFSEKCMVCHGKAGEGLVGPNLTDDYWLHGGKINDIFKIIKYGFPSKGMLAWQGQLTPVQMQQVASYIKSIHGTNPPNAKESQGDLYQDSVTAAGSDSVVAVVSSKAEEATN